MNGSLKWVGGIAAALIVAIVGWLFHTVHDLDKSVAEIQASLRDASATRDQIRRDEAADVSELKAALEKAKDDIEDLQKGKR